MRDFIGLVRGLALLDPAIKERLGSAAASASDKLRRLIALALEGWADRAQRPGMGITTVADLASTDAQLLTSTFGPTTGLWILLLAKGGGDTEVSAQPWVARSRSHVITFPRDLTDRAEIDSAVVELAELTLAEIVDQGRVVTRVAVTVRTKTFFTRTKIRKLAVGGQRPTDHRGHRTGSAAPVRTGPPRPAARCAIGTRRTRRRLLVPASTPSAAAHG